MAAKLLACLDEVTAEERAMSEAHPKSPFCGRNEMEASVRRKMPAD
jgi:hypothetical protein